MNISLTPLLERFVTSMNAQDSAAFTHCFADSAIVQDEGHTHEGTAAINAWIEKAFTSYQPVLEVSNVQPTAGGTVLTGTVSGTFPGSPIVLHYHLSHDEHYITALKCEA